jgi:HipA-like C-terminal domain
LPRDTGQFSLAGAQPKIALLFENDRWGVPSGRTPTTHILKPPTGHFDGHAENEHICLGLARALGKPLRDIGLSEWRKLARDIRIDAAALIGRIAAMANQLPDELSAVRTRAQEDGLAQPIIGRLAGRLAERALACRKVLGSGANG